MIKVKLGNWKYKYIALLIGWLRLYAEFNSKRWGVWMAWRGPYAGIFYRWNYSTILGPFRFEVEHE